MKEQTKHQTEIFEYIRRRRGGKVHKVGVIYGTTEDNTIKIGWSKCNIKEGDEFNADLGVLLAKERAIESPANAPLCMKRHLRNFSCRCLRYFKDAKKIALPV